MDWTREELEYVKAALSTHFSYVTETRWDLVEEGMTRWKVRELLGSPSNIEYEHSYDMWTYKYPNAIDGYIYFHREADRVYDFSRPIFR